MFDKVVNTEYAAERNVPLIDSFPECSLAGAFVRILR